MQKINLVLHPAHAKGLVNIYTQHSVATKRFEFGLLVLLEEEILWDYVPCLPDNFYNDC